MWQVNSRNDRSADRRVNTTRTNDMQGVMMELHSQAPLVRGPKYQFSEDAPRSLSYWERYNVNGSPSHSSSSTVPPYPDGRLDVPSTRTHDTRRRDPRNEASSTGVGCPTTTKAVRDGAGPGASTRVMSRHPASTSLSPNAVGRPTSAGATGWRGKGLHDSPAKTASEVVRMGHTLPSSARRALRVSARAGAIIRRRGPGRGGSRPGRRPRPRGTSPSPGWPRRG